MPQVAERGKQVVPVGRAEFRDLPNDMGDEALAAESLDLCIGFQQDDDRSPARRGQLFDNMMAAIGLDRKSAYITNILPWRPPGNRNPTPDEIATCLPFARRQIELLAPKVLVPVGGVAAKTLLERSEGITRLRGTWRDYTSPGLTAPVPALPTFHPAYLLRTPAQKRAAWRDLLMIRQRLDGADGA